MWDSPGENIFQKFILNFSEIFSKFLQILKVRWENEKKFRSIFLQFFRISPRNIFVGNFFSIFPSIFRFSLIILNLSKFLIKMKKSEETRMGFWKYFHLGRNVSQKSTRNFFLIVWNFFQNSSEFLRDNFEIFRGFENSMRKLKIYPKPSSSTVFLNFSSLYFLWNFLVSIFPITF